MSSFKNAVKRDIHKERSQPSNRRRLGLLEKHKDYVKRAKDYHKKTGKIRALEEKARNRNKDEFYTKMVNTRTEKGIHVDTRKPDVIDVETAKLMKTQDASYVLTHRQIALRRAERLQGQLHFVGAPVKNTHKVFVDEDEEVEAFNPAEYFETDERLVSRRHNRVRIADLEKAEEEGPVAPRRDRKGKRAERKRDRAYVALTAELDRAAKLGRSWQHIEAQRIGMSSGEKKKVKAATGMAPALYKFKRKRQK